jgi:deoxyribodipyrimidine photolyase-related protein
VVEPNVLAMGTFGTSTMTTKPYIAGSGYISKMSDYCGSCAFHPKKTCPLPHLYWAWLQRHGDALAGNNRMAIPLKSLSRRAPEKRAADAAVFDHLRTELSAGRAVTPASVSAARAESA